MDWLTQRTHYTAEEVQILHAGTKTPFVFNIQLYGFAINTQQVSFVISPRAEYSEVTLRFSFSVGKPARKWLTLSSGLLVFHKENSLNDESTPKNLFRTLDTDNNGYLDFTEFLLAMDLVAARWILN